MRSKNSIFNILGTFGAYFLTVIFNFIIQRCIINSLGIEYSGINGLFSNIITMLSVAELGIGTTIIFKLYKPIADKNIEQIKSWMNFYKTCYRYVALIVTILGIAVIPFIPKIVGEVSINENLIILYIITLLDTIFSYIMTYKRSLLYADQKNYIINIVHMLYTVFMNVTQIILLYMFKNYIIFLIVKVIYRVLENVIINIIVDKKYPYIKTEAEELSKEERKDVFDRIKAILLQKISFVINKGIDNIVISICLSVVAVGYYTNYNIIVIAISNIIYQIVSSMTASVGNLLTENDTEKFYGIYKKINLLNSFITGIAMVGFACVITPFIKVWVGSEYLLDNFIMFSFVLYIYSDSIRRAITLFKEAAGICKEDKYMYVIMVVLNLIASIVLCKLIGIAGVILGTAISYLFLILYSYPKYIFKPIFKRNVKDYYLENLKYVLFIGISLLISFGICNQIYISNTILNIITNGIIAVGISSIVFVIMFRKTDEFKYYYNFIIKILKGLKKEKIK